LASSLAYLQITDYKVISLSNAFDIFVHCGFLHKNHNEIFVRLHIGQKINSTSTLFWAAHSN